MRVQVASAGHTSTSVLDGTRWVPDEEPEHVVADGTGGLHEADESNHHPAAVGVYLGDRFAHVYGAGRVRNDGGRVQDEQAHAARVSRPSAARTSARFSGVIRASAAASLRRNWARASARSSSVAEGSVPAAAAWQGYPAGVAGSLP
jgi:hypothetical protein